MALLLAACRARTTATPTTAPATTTLAPAATTTAPPPATQTAAPTSAPSDTPAAPSATPAGGGEASATPDASAAPSATPLLVSSGTHLAEFLADLTAPDGADFIPGEVFVKTWQLKNAGTATWTTAYSLVYVSGEQMGGPDSVPLPGDVAPGAAVDISVDLTAPAKLGAYTGFWMLRTPAGDLFGLGPNANQPVYVQIDVVIGGTPQPTAPPGSLSVSAAELSVDQASLSGVCPQTFQFNLSFTSQGAGAVTYRLEASADTPGFTFNLPEPANSIFNTAGPRTFSVTYNLQFTNSVTGQVWAHITSPTDLVTNKVAFALNCAATATP
ncbi:MAG: hypothetical protein IT317_24205 [Anaerolineales bacterium]|nr:hypothetical protein [Anaerolineales bacterium]